MNSNLKLGLYAASVVGLLVFGALFVRAWRSADALASAGARAAVAPPTTQAVATNLPAAGTNDATASAAPPTHVTATATATATAVEAQTPDAPAVAREESAKATEPTPEQEPVPDSTAGRVSGKRLADMIAWGLLTVVSIAGLGVLMAHDFSSAVAAKATRALFQEDAQGIEATDYEAVENAHTSGDFLEAIRLLREYHKENPRAVHAQIRIAEIYEKDLNNPLAAALEYEEVLKHPLEPDRWGWTAVHLVNLYNRLEKTDQAVHWLQRIVQERPQTPAAAKARERLTALGFVVEEEGETDADTASQPPDDTGASEGGLPRGFRRK